MANLTSDPLLDLLAEFEHRRRRSLSREQCREIDRAWADCARAAFGERVGPAAGEPGNKRSDA
jgi:hypothetical protein